jgi:hypothetical protein
MSRIEVLSFNNVWLLWRDVAENDVGYEVQRAYKTWNVVRVTRIDA